ncbi:uncharacterized protein LOC131230813 [Magnolia sinica]|uniref:uncharacterized protein LOC131230813 n=1 Tax=Magnolia sinica TaxID=86752 RepID=UPI00265B5FE9|nr:uncharacterized protein LOC131230813 [Magnolia sinica]
MESLPSISPSMSIVYQQWPRRRMFFTCPRRRHDRIPAASFSSFLSTSTPISHFPEPCSMTPRGRRRETTACGSSTRGGDAGEDDGNDLEKALHMDGSIPGTSDEFVKQVSSRAYDMRRHLEQTIDCSSYDVLEANPWREASKPVYVLTQRENQLCTMKTRRSRSEVERELGLLFSKGGKWRSEIGNTAKPRTSTKFHMLVEDIREGVLVFEDEHDAARYCDLLQGGGQGCEGIAELEAASVFDICRKMRALAVLFRRGRTLPLPESLQQNLKARKRSLEDREDLI